MSDKPKTNDNPDGSDSELLRPSCSLSSFALECLEILRFKNGRSTSTSEIAMRMQSNRLAVTSAMRALEKRGIVGFHRWPKDRWGTMHWFILENKRSTR